MPDDAARSGPSSAPDPWLAPVQQVLALLTQQPVLLAVTVPCPVADERYDITVSKAGDDEGAVQPGFWWEVDRLTCDAQGQPHWERRWGLGLQASETPDAAYLAALQWVDRRVIRRQDRSGEGG